MKHKYSGKGGGIESLWHQQARAETSAFVLFMAHFQVMQLPVTQSFFHKPTKYN